MDEFKTIFDFGEEFPRIMPTIFFLIPCLVSICFLFRIRKQPDSEEKGRLELPKNLELKIGLLILSLFTGIFSVSMINPASYLEARRIYRSDTLKTVEGRLVNFHPHNKEVNPNEYFDVNQIRFEYSSADLSRYSFTNDITRYGIIQEGIYVRIKYYTSNGRNYILKLEVKKERGW